LTESIFEVVGEDRFLPTEASLSPWTEEAMHGGPPTMLMARAIERFDPEPQMVVKRLTVELLRPVGRTPLEVRCRLVRPGRKVQLVEASLWNGQHEVARATAVRIRSASVDVPEKAEKLARDDPDSLVAWKGGWRSGPAYHELAMEIRGAVKAVHGAAGWAWFRLRLPLLPGEEPSGLLRICAAADFPNGISYVVDPRQTSFVNPDLTIYVRRLPVDEWVLVDATTWLDPDGTGIAEGALYDRRGRIGRSVQSLLIEKRG